MKFSLAAATSALILTTPLAAFACGGFFCNNSAPVNQAAEDILFAVEGDEIEAHVAVQYTGPSEEFAWIVPTPSRPEVGVSSTAVFRQLYNVAGVRFNLTYREIGECDWDTRGGGAGGADSAGGFADAGTAEDGAGDPGVVVVEQSSVGPYDFAVLQATSAEPLFDWLEANDYDIPRGVMPFVEPYLLMDDDMHFVAFRLTKDADAGDIAPITLRYTAEQPVIPIQLTAVAADPDLGIRTFILGDHRSVPENYPHVHINEARIDWLSGGSNYDAIVTEAMDEAGGQGFATEYAGAASLLDDMFWNDMIAETVESATALSDPAMYWDQMQQALMRLGLQGDPIILELLQEYIPIPERLESEGIEPQWFYNCIECYAEEGDFEDFDPEAFTAALDERIFEPMRHAQDLFDGAAYLSSLYTTMSADEMTLDPAFTFNPDMDDVSNNRNAELITDCGDGRRYEDAPRTLRLSDGREIRMGTWGESWAGSGGGGDTADLDGLPAAERIEETGASGQAVVIDDRAPEINAELEAHNEVYDAEVARRERNDDGCAAAGGGAGGGAGALALLGLAAALRRRR